MRVVLFGHKGQLGASILNRFASAFEWICPERTQLEGDLSNPGAVAEYLRYLSPDAIVNAAAFTAVDKARQYYKDAETVNALAPAAMARVAAHCNAYFIHFSTDYVFDGSGRQPWSEADVPAPINAYGKTKALGEKLVIQEDGSSIILRLSWLHAGHHRNFVTAICEQLKKGRNISVVDDQWGSPTAASDVAQIVEKLLICYKEGNALNGIFHFANDGYCSRYDCACEIIRQLQKAGVPWSFNRDIQIAKTADFPSSEPRPLNCRLNTKKINERLKIAPRSWQEALGATLVQYQEN